jgi:hypothetical protein
MRDWSRKPGGREQGELRRVEITLSSFRGGKQIIKSNNTKKRKAVVERKEKARENNFQRSTLDKISQGTINI